MTAAELRLLDKVKRRAAELSPNLRDAMLRAFDRLRSNLSETQIASMLANGSTDTVIFEAFSDEVLTASLNVVRDSLRLGIVNSATSFTRDLPIARRSAVAFDTLSPNVVTGIRSLESRVMTTLKTDIRESARQIALRGIEAGKSPKAVARELRDVVGLAPNQESAVANFRKMLETGDREALNRALRDKRFDGTLKKALGPDGNGLSVEQIDRMSESYRRRVLAFNAETNAKTAAMDAQKLGQRLSWQNAIDQGIVDRGSLMKRWRGTMDDRERPEHVAMEGEEVHFDAPFSNGQTIPGDSDFNCRCVPVYFLA